MEGRVGAGDRHAVVAADAVLYFVDTAVPAGFVHAPFRAGCRGQAGLIERDLDVVDVHADGCVCAVAAETDLRIGAHVTGEVELPADKEMVMPGDTVTFKVKLLAPIAMDQGLRFAIREGGRTVGAGVVTKITK